MNSSFWLPLVIPLTSLVAGVIIFFLKEEQFGLRTFLNLFSAVLKIFLVGILLWGVYHQHVYEFRIPLFAGFDLVLHADALSLLFVSLSAILWLLTTIYAIGYLEKSPDRSRFFGFFCFCVSATTGIALAGNLFTFLVFYELLTLTTYPLVTHRGTPQSLAAGRVYLFYTLGGGALLLVAMVWLSSLAGPVDFVEQGVLAGLGGNQRGSLTAIFALLVIGFGVKAALVPLHGWLPLAMVAPAPVSALLHAVAVVKAGAFGVVRVVYDIYGVELCQSLGVLHGVGICASVTIIYGSLRALFQDDLKRRLAYSTVSQVSYIMLGVATVGPLATVGGIVHLVHQGVMKITLFFCAGNFAEGLKVSRVSQMNGIGRLMPWTMVPFTVAVFGMIGVPPMAGFISKWHLGWGALEAGQPWVVLVLLGSSLLNAGYFLPILYVAWFRESELAWTEETAGRWHRTRLYLLIPPVATAIATLIFGLLAGLPTSPLAWAKLIAIREYGL